MANNWRKQMMEEDEAVKKSDRKEDQSMKDGIALMYIKEGTLYPVAMTAEQHQMLTMLVAGICKPLHVMTEFPQGKAVNLVGDKK